MNKNRRWLKSILATSRDIAVVLPWTRAHRRKPVAVTVTVTRRSGMAAR